MHVAGIVGPDADAFADRLVASLGERGRVARVRRTDATADGGTLVASADADTTYDLGDDGARVTGPPRSLADALDELAPTHDYAVVTGHPHARIPRVVVGDEDGSGRLGGHVVARLDSAGADESAWEEALAAIEDARARETIPSLVARAKASPEADRAGAIATFTGRVRARDDPDDPETTHLEFEMYEGVAEERMAEIAEELESREGVFAVRMHHRTGVVEAGEDIVFVVVLAGHRSEAFATVSDGIDRLKAEVPIFKKEVTLEGEFWAHERPK